MKRRIGLLVVAALMGTLGFFAPSSPASANTEPCAGTGVAMLNTGFGYPVLNPKNTANFTFNFTVGGCPLTKGSFQAFGTVNGWCGLSTGKGQTDAGHPFVFQSTGTVLVLTGTVNGTVSAAPDPTASGSCLSKTATRFLVTGAVMKTHCATTVTEVKSKDLNTQAWVCV